MAFSEDLKMELWQSDMPKSPCCRRSLAYGILFCAEMNGSMMTFKLPNMAMGKEIATFFENVFQITTNLEPYRHAGHIYGKITIVNHKIIALLQRIQISDLPLEKLLNFSCDHCKQFFLRGVFISSASLTDPNKSYHLELSCHDHTTMRHLSSLLGEIGCVPKCVERKGGLHLYYKNSSEIEDILTNLNAKKTLFAFIDAKISNDIRNNENRATNCVTKNIQKSVEAAAEQIEAIRRLQQSTGWEKIPPALRKTAELRLKYDSATLEELALLHEPPISKSGLNHRLLKLILLSKEKDK